MTIADPNKYRVFYADSPRKLVKLYDEMRTNDPIYKGTGPQTGNTIWFMTTYEDCVNVLRDQRFIKDKDNLPPELAAKFTYESAFDMIGEHLLNQDPPDHTRLRTLVHKAFTPRIIQDMSSRVEQLALDFIAKMPDEGEIDFIQSFALPIPITVIAELLGIPSEDQMQFREWTERILFAQDEDGFQTAIMEFVMYLHDFFDDRLANPQDDLTSKLVQVEEEGEKLDRQELLSMMFLLIVAGHETTVNLIGNGTLALIENPDQQAKLRQNLNLMPTAIEEMLRFNSPVNFTTERWAGEDIDYKGHQIKAGDPIYTLLLAANRDPAQFENPDVFDIERSPNKHIAFGNGIHYCLGAPLARLEGNIAFKVLLENISEIDLAVDYDQLEWNMSLLLNGMKSMPVRIKK